jgi:hypothetical protein
MVHQSRPRLRGALCPKGATFSARFHRTRDGSPVRASRGADVHSPARLGAATRKNGLGRFIHESVGFAFWRLFELTRNQNAGSA